MGGEWGPKIQGASHPLNRESKGEASIPNPWEWGHAQNWGVPGRAIHAYSRDWGCVRDRGKGELGRGRHREQLGAARYRVQLAVKQALLLVLKVVSTNNLF